MNSTGKYFASKHKSSGSKVWNPPSSQRFYKSSKHNFIKAQEYLEQETTTRTMILVILENTFFLLQKDLEEENLTSNSGKVLSMSLQK